MHTTTVAPELDPIQRLTRDLKDAAITLSPDEARYLVDAYYAMQGDRIRSDNQVRALDASNEPHLVLAWLAGNTRQLEGNIKRALDSFSDRDRTGRWAKSIVGIGPVIAAGLSAHIDLEPWRCAVASADHKAKKCTPTEPHGPACQSQRVRTVGKIWRFAGLDPTVRWEKGQKRPWNATLKTLAWKIGESFVKVSNHEQDFYGHLWAQRKLAEQARNDAGALAEQAAAKLDRFKIGKGTDAYKAYSIGKLPPAHIHARAKRWTVKLFLSHWFTVAYFERFGEMPPKPYVLSQLGHVDEIQVPNWPF